MKAIIPAAAGIISAGVIFYIICVHRRKKKSSGDGSDDSVETLEFVVTSKQIPAIIGRNSVILKSIEDKTQTIIKFREIDDSKQMCSIRGKRSNVIEAKQLMDLEISKPQIITEEIFVPTMPHGIIAGYSSSVLHEICSESLAKVWVDPSESRKNVSENRRVLITGTKEQVSHAKKLIDSKIKEAPKEETKPENGNATEENHKLNQNNSSESIPVLTETQREILLPSPEKLKNNEGQLEVFVSAVHSPSRFWMQLIGRQSMELEFLVNAMTEYYNLKENQQLHRLREPHLGQIVAAMLLSDSKWYRAEIVATQVNKTLPHELLYEVYFLDYGDNQFVSKNAMLELRADFLSLRFQAIECFLADVQPKDVGNNLDEWDEKAVEKFEELVQVAHWKKLISKVVTYRNRKSFDVQTKARHRESSPVPGIELYDPDDVAQKNIAFELIRLGYAEPRAEPLSNKFGDLSKSAILIQTEKLIEEN